MSKNEQKSGSVQTTQTTPPPPSQGPSVTTNNVTYRLPCDATLQNAAKLSIVEDKPVLFDYWADSLDKKALIGVREGTGEKLLVKSAEEYTSPIAKFYKSLTEYIVITENSIYIVASDIPTRKIS
jgi:hypothetical protein